MNAKNLIAISRITPQQVNCNLLHLSVNLSKGYLKWSLNLFNIFNFVNVATHTTVNQEDIIQVLLVLYLSSKWKPVKQIIDLLEYTIGIIYVLAKTSLAFISKTAVSVYSSVFMVSSKQEYLLRVL